MRNIKKHALKIMLSMGLSTLSAEALALTFALPKDGNIVGQIQTTTVRSGESLADIGRRYDVGVWEMREANPGVDTWEPSAGTRVIIPTQFILPSAPRVGIVLNLAEMRLYYYHPGGTHVSTHPVGIGKKGWSTPLGVTTILSKKKNPSWTPPEGIRREHLAKGDILPPVVPAGPDNPLGRYAFYLGFKGYLLHGTNTVGGVGLRSSHGCIRMLPQDIESLYYSVPVGTQLRVVHEPYKVGWHKDKLYLEAHRPLSDGRYVGSNSLNRLKHAIKSTVKESTRINWNSAVTAAERPRGYPTKIN